MAVDQEIRHMRASLAGQIKQTQLPQWKPLLPLFEAVMNAIHAIQEVPVDNPSITVQVLREENILFDAESRITGFVIDDNGAGLTPKNMESFNTAFSEYKQRRGGKGLGRFLFLKAFERAEVQSSYVDSADGQTYSRSFHFDSSYTEDICGFSESAIARAGTNIRLLEYKKPYSDICPQDSEVIAHRLVEHFVLILMGTDCPKITLIDGKTRISLNDFFEQHFVKNSNSREFSIGASKFEIFGFRLFDSRVTRHRLVYAANDRAVEHDNLDDYVENLTGQIADELDKKFIYLAVVKGDFLNERVNAGRTSFDISEEKLQNEILDLGLSDIRKSDIREHCISFVQDDLHDILHALDEVKREKVVKYINEQSPQYKILVKDLDKFISSIPRNCTFSVIEESLHRELHKKEILLKRQGKKIITDAAKLENYDEYKDKLNEFIENYNDLGIASLAQHVMHRKIILDFFERALEIDEKSDKYPLEKVLHQIIFPMRASSDDVFHSQQNLWILDERLNYHNVVYSDKSLKSIPEIESDSSMRPDLLVFDRDFGLAEGEGPLTNLTVVEFKRPMRGDYRTDDNPLRQVAEVVEEIRSGKAKNSKERPISVSNGDIPTTCYVICDITASLEKVLRDWSAVKMPNAEGYYGYSSGYKFYYEVLSYNQLLLDAQRRNKMLFEKLNIL